MKKISGAEYFAKILKENNVTHIFYQEEALSRILSNLESNYGIKPILAHSELSVGYMADGYARASNRPSVCYSQSIGSANLAAGLHDAWLGNSPVIALTCHKESKFQFRNAYQESNHTAHFSGVTKFNVPPLNSNEFPHLIRQCFREVTTGNPRPAHMELEGVGGEVFEISEMNEAFISDPTYSVFPAFRTAAPNDLVEQAATLINASRQPIIISGKGVFISDTDNFLSLLAERANIPVTTTPDGKTTLDEAHPLWTGVIGTYGMSCANSALTQCDLAIVIGSQLSDQTTLCYTNPKANVPIIQIDIEPSQIGKIYPNTLGLVGDAGTVMRQLFALLDYKKRTNWIKLCSDLVLKNKAEQKFLEESICYGGINTALLCKHITDALPHNAILFSDTGWSAVWASTSIRMKATQKFIRAAGTLGWALPASIGGKCANPERPVFCFCGDGGILYHLLELETAARYNIPTITILNNNSCYAQVVDCMSEFFSPIDERQKFINQKERNTFGPINYSKIAEQLGVSAFRVEKASDIAPAIQNAISLNQPVLIEVITDWQSKPLSY